MFRLLAALPRITDMHLMLQKEVVDRMVSPPGGRAYGRLSVMVQLDCEAERVIPGRFRGVHSRTARRVRGGAAASPAAHRPGPGGPRSTRGPSSDRASRVDARTLRNALRGLCHERVIAAAGLDPHVRPEMLTVEAFVDLALASLVRE